MKELNLLINSAFIGEDLDDNDPDASIVAGSWAAWWLPRPKGEPEWKMIEPTFSLVAIDVDAPPVQAVKSPFATHVGGLWQQMPAFIGSEYEFIVDAQVWSSESEQIGQIVEPADVPVQIGIDPTGGLDPESPLIIWSRPSQAIERWRSLRMAAVSEANIITLYLKSAPKTPKRQQSIFWRDAVVAPTGEFRRVKAIIGPGDSYINVAPDQPIEDDILEISVNSLRPLDGIALIIRRGEEAWNTVALAQAQVAQDRYIWQAIYGVELPGSYDIRCVGDNGARLWAQYLIKVESRDYLKESAAAAPSGAPRQEYRRIYILLPPTADENWLIAAAKGGFEGRYSIGFSADDAGIGELERRHVIAVNPHHWKEPLTAAWYHQHYPGVRFTPVVAKAPKDLEAWLKRWNADEVMG